ncbi:MAG: glycerol-3-phosphate 1-O-acyltransferase PlsY [Cyanobacteria bacterium J06598_1]
MGLSIAITLLSLLVAYLLGSIPTGFLLVKALKGTDIRDYGSGNTGATNVFRVAGKGPGVAALLIDLMKGATAVRLMVWLAFSSNLVPFPIGSLLDPASVELWGYILCTLAGLLAVLGHSKSVWLGFSGGKSAATGLGVLLALTWPVGLGLAVVFGVALGLSRTVSVGSIAAALSAFVLMVLTQQPLPYILLALLGGCYVIFLHRSNISRLIAGTEPKTFGG